MAVAAHALPHFGLRAARQALLVIHGIGEQNPYETLDSFARGVFMHLTEGRHFRARLCPVEIAHKDWTQVGMRIDIFPPAPALPPCPDKDAPPAAKQKESKTNETKEAKLESLGHVDIFEYYWAPLTEDKLSASNTLKWVLKTDFTPLRYFADNLQEMLGVYRLNLRQAIGKALAIYWRELLRVFCLYLALGMGAALLLWWLPKPQAWGAALKGIVAALLPLLTVEHSIILFFYFAFLLMAWFLLQSLFELYRQRGPSLQSTSERIWAALNLTLGLAFLVLAVWLDRRAGSHMPWHVWRAISQSGHWQPLVGAAIAAIVSYALTAYVADVAVYVNTDAKSKNFAARNAILDGSTAALKMLLASEKYDRVILAGHSLGSVIAYDTINDLLAERSADPGPASDPPNPYLQLAQLQKLKGLVTFGSPLDKVYYFFREHVKRDQAIRAQVLSMLHSFRRDFSGRDYGKFSFNYYMRQLDDQADPLIWLNAWAVADPVSGELKFYFPNDQRKFPYHVPVLAHLSYWGDPNFYDYFCERLL